MFIFCIHSLEKLRIFYFSYFYICCLHFWVVPARSGILCNSLAHCRGECSSNRLITVTKIAPFWGAIIFQGEWTPQFFDDVWNGGPSSCVRWVGADKSNFTIIILKYGPFQAPLKRRWPLWGFKREDLLLPPFILSFPSGGRVQS